MYIKRKEKLNIFFSTTLMMLLTCLTPVTLRQAWGKALQIDSQAVIQVIKEYVDQMKGKSDPLIALEGETFVKRSNLFGVRIGGITYYYNLSPHATFDPLARGEVTQEDIKIINSEQSNSFPLLIYLIIDPEKERRLNPIEAARRAIIKARAKR
ncbi:MAG: hypothetical protein HY731_12635 [Candidatus Tectomicrobia bacterium]|nr:hypothetical protein [Candidatus Tectomicrobia bacterium]